MVDLRTLERKVGKLAALSKRPAINSNQMGEAVYWAQVRAARSVKDGHPDAGRHSSLAEGVIDEVKAGAPDEYCDQAIAEFEQEGIGRPTNNHTTQSRR